MNVLQCLEHSGQEAAVGSLADACLGLTSIPPLVSTLVEVGAVADS